MIREDTDPNSPTYGQYIEDADTADPSTLNGHHGNYTGAQGIQQIMAAYRAAGVEPTTGQILEWGQNPSKEEVDNAIFTLSLLPGYRKNGAALTDPNATPTGSTGTGTGGTGTGGGAVTPFTGGEAEFVALFGRPSTTRELEALESRLKEYGITLARNASGVAGKIRLPNGEIKDVILNAGKGGSGFWWGEGGGSDTNGAGGSGYGAINQELLDPFTTPFQPGDDTNLPKPPDVSPFSYPDFQVPDPTQIALDPSYQFRLQQGEDAISANRAARGTLNTGGTIKDYLSFGQGLASQEYGNVFDRGFRTYGANRDNAFGSWLANTTQGNTNFGQQKGLADDAYGRAWAQYQNLENIFRQNQNGPADKLFRLANIGSQAAEV